MTTSQILGRRLDHLLLVVGGVTTVVGSFLPWIEGSSKLNGYINWNGVSDTGEGAMLITLVLAQLAWVRWGHLITEVDVRARFLPLTLAVIGIALWLIVVQKALYLAYWEIEVGARPRIGLLVVIAGLLAQAVGGYLVATDPVIVAAGRAERERERRRSGAGGDGAASDRLRRGGGGRPSEPGGYSVVSRVDRSIGPDAGPAGDRDQG